MNKNLARRAFALLLCALMLIPLFMVTAVADVSSEVKIDSIIADYDEETGELVYTVSASCTGKLAGQSHVYRYTWERCLISETRDSAGTLRMLRAGIGPPLTTMNQNLSCALSLKLRRITSTG